MAIRTRGAALAGKPFACLELQPQNRRRRASRSCEAGHSSGRPDLAEHKRQDQLAEPSERLDFWPSGLRGGAGLQGGWTQASRQLTPQGQPDIMLCQQLYQVVEPI